jgi:hypothetical protein
VKVSCSLVRYAGVITSSCFGMLSSIVIPTPTFVADHFCFADLFQSRSRGF